MIFVCWDMNVTVAIQSMSHVHVGPRELETAHVLQDKRRRQQVLRAEARIGIFLQATIDKIIEISRETRPGAWRLVVADSFNHRPVAGRASHDFGRRARAGGEGVALAAAVRTLLGGQREATLGHCQQCQTQRPVQAREKHISKTI